MLTRARFGAFDREVWTIQWILTELDYSPGPIDGLWGSQTFGAVSDFRQLMGLPPAAGTTKAGAVDQEFMVALWGQAIEYDLDVPTSPSGGASGGTSTRPVAVPTGQTRPGVTPTTTPIAQASSLDLTALLALGAVGIGAVLLSRRR